MTSHSLTFVVCVSKSDQTLTTQRLYFYNCNLKQLKMIRTNLRYDHGGISIRQYLKHWTVLAHGNVQHILPFHLGILIKMCTQPPAKNALKDLVAICFLIYQPLFFQVTDMYCFSHPDLKKNLSGLSHCISFKVQSVLYFYIRLFQWSLSWNIIYSFKFKNMSLFFHR